MQKMIEKDNYIINEILYLPVNFGRPVLGALHLSEGNSCQSFPLLLSVAPSRSHCDHSEGWRRLEVSSCASP